MVAATLAVTAIALHASLAAKASAFHTHSTSSTTTLSTSQSLADIIAPALRIAGSSTVVPVAEAWQDLIPDNYAYIIDGGGSSSGARRVCAPSNDPDHVHIGGMSRAWRTTEAERLDDGNTFECLDPVSGMRTGRRVTQLQVGIEALVFVVKKDGAAHECLTHTNVGGLTIAQLRWIFTDWTDAELAAAPYGNLDLSSIIANDDGDGIKEWSDIDSACKEVPINPYGAGGQSGSSDFFATAVFNGEKSETFDICNVTQVSYLEQITPSSAADELLKNQRDTLGASNCYASSEDDSLIRDWILADTGGIAFFGYAYYSRSQQMLTVSRIADDRVKGIADTDEAVVTPDIYSIRDGSYSMFTRTLFMNVDNTAWSNVRDYLATGFSTQGQLAVSTLGYVPINAAIRTKMQNQIQDGENLAADYVPVRPLECANGTELRSTMYINPYGNLKENFTCMPCEPGFFKWANTPTSCEPCAKGEVAPEPGRSACDACQRGLYAHGAGLSACSSCWTGTFVAYQGATACDACSPGEVQALEGASACMDCPPGTYQPNASGIECIACEPGQYAAAPGQTSCALCDPGYFQAHPAADSPCSRCPRGNYSEEPGAVDCRACLPGLTTPYPGSYSIEQCVCGPGTYMPSSGSPRLEHPCVTCPSGTECLIGSFERYLPIESSYACAPDMLCNYPVLDPGYMSIATEPLKVYKCLSEKHCPGGAPAQCAAYRDTTEVACGDCQDEPRAFRRGDTCELCSGPDIIPLIIAIVFFVAALCAAAFVLNRDAVKRSSATTTVAVVIGLTVGCLQCLAVFSALKLEWFEPIKGIINVMSVFGLDPSIVRVTCNVSAGPITNFLVRQLVAPISVAIIFLALLIKKRLVQRDAQVLVELLNTVGMIFSFLFISVVISAITPLICYNHPNGNGQSMVAFPAVLCYEDDIWFGFIAVGSLSMLFVVIPFLVVCGYGTWSYTTWLMSNKLAWLTGYQFLFTRFKGERYYYGLILLLRSFLIPCIPAVVRGSIAFQVVLVSSVLLFFLVTQMYLRPWRLKMINMYDATLSAWLVIVLVCGIASSDFTAERDSIEFLFAAIFIMTLLIIVFTFAKSAKDRFYPAARFEDFICHHKEGAGAQARFLKIILFKMGKRRVFIDSDDLQQLDSVFDIVRSRISRLIVLLSRNTLSRPWCCGEIVTAYMNGVSTVVVTASDFQMPQGTSTQHWSVLLDFNNSCLVQYGVALDTVAKACTRLLDGSVKLISVKTSHCGRARLQQVAEELLNRSGISGSTKMRRRPTEGWKDAVLLCSDPDDDEASATAGILVDKIGERVLQERRITNGMIVLADMDCEFEDNMDAEISILVQDARTCIVILTPYSMHSLVQLKVIVQAIASTAIDLIPVSTPQYDFPTEAYYANSLPVLARRILVEEPEAVVESMRAFFKTIAVHFGTHCSDKVIETQAIEIFKRIPTASNTDSRPLSPTTPRRQLLGDDEELKVRPYRRGNLEGVGSGMLTDKMAAGTASAATMSSSSTRPPSTPMASVRMQASRSWASSRYLGGASGPLRVDFGDLETGGGDLPRTTSGSASAALKSPFASSSTKTFRVMQPAAERGGCGHATDISPLPPAGIGDEVGGGKHQEADVEEKAAALASAAAMPSTPSAIALAMAKVSGASKLKNDVGEWTLIVECGEANMWELML